MLCQNSIEPFHMLVYIEDRQHQRKLLLIPVFHKSWAVIYVQEFKQGIHLTYFVPILGEEWRWKRCEVRMSSWEKKNPFIKLSQGKNQIWQASEYQR